MASRFVTCSAALRFFDLYSRRPQISLFVCAAVVSAIVYLLEYRLLRWRLIGKEVEGDRIWKNLRRFSGWACAGFIAGAVAFSSTLRGNALRYESLVPGISRRQVYQLEAAAARHLVSVDFFFPSHLLCVIFALNMLMRRVSDHASHSYYNEARDHVSTGHSTGNKRFDWRDCVGQYALYRPLHP